MGRVLQDVTGFAGSQYFMRFATLVKGFVVAKVLGPEGNGLWQHFVILGEYCQFTHLGALPGMNKVLGHRIGQSDEAGAARARATGLGAVVFASSILWVILASVSLGRDPGLEPVERWGLAVLGLIVVLEQVNFTFMAFLRAYSRIQVISLFSFGFAAANLVISLALLPSFGVLGLLMGWAISRAATTAWMAHKSGFAFRLALRAGVLRELLVTGFPIFLFHLTRVGLRNIDRVLVDSVLARGDLGIYGLAVTIASLVRYAAEAVGFVVYPIFLRRFGETRDPQALMDLLTRPTRLLGLGIPFVLGLAYLVLHLPVLWLLPRFVPCIEIYRLLTISVLFSCLAILPGFFLMAVNRQNWLVPMGLATIAFEYLVGFELVRRGWGLPGVAMTMGAGTGAYCTAVMLFSGRIAMGSTRAAGGWVVRTYGPAVCFAALVAALRWIVPRTAVGQWNEYYRAGLEGALFLAFSVPILWWVERKTGLLGAFAREAD